MKPFIHAPQNDTPIREFWVFFSVDENGDGIVSTEFAGMMLPLVAGNPDLVEKMKPEAAHIARITGKRIVLAKFTTREDLWSTEPRQ